MDYQCTKCRAINSIPAEREGADYVVCRECGGQIKPAAQNPENGDTSMAVGFLGGVALGASVGGPVGAIIGGVVGAVAGKKAKGLG